jgi:hypothetical protein
MKILVFALQSSGASLFTYLLAQIPNSIGIIDLWDNTILAPKINSPYPVILKIVPTVTYTLEENINSFQPTKRILFIRNPFDNYFSLNPKIYRDEAGTLEQKFAMMDQIFAEREKLFDTTFYYEEFFRQPELFIRSIREKIAEDLPSDADQFKRSLDEIMTFNQQHCAWCQGTFQVNWGFGNIHQKNLQHKKAVSYKKNDPAIQQKVEQLAPNLCQYYMEKTK